MLTKNEREWLLRRSKKAMFCATWCSAPLLDCCDACAEGSCPTRGGDMEDAAEFSERVAARLAEFGECPSWFPMQCVGNMSVPCNWCKLKAARLQVEEEMDADGK